MTHYVTSPQTLRWYLHGMQRRIDNRQEPLSPTWFVDGMGTPLYGTAVHERATAEIEGWRYMDKLYKLAAA